MGLPCASTTVLTGVAMATSRVDTTRRLRPMGKAKLNPGSVTVRVTLPQ